MAVAFEAIHDVIVCCNAVAVVAGLESFDQDHIAVAVVRQDDVVVADAGADGEAAHIVGVEIAHWLDNNDELIGLHGRELTGEAYRWPFCAWWSVAWTGPCDLGLS